MRGVVTGVTGVTDGGDTMTEAGPAWTDADLDAWRAVTDPPADAAVAGYFAATSHHHPRHLFGSLVEHLRLPPEDQVPAIAEFLAAAATMPDWAERERIARGQQFFSDWAVHQFTSLYLASLPNAYAAAKGVHVIWLTARLQNDPRRRLNETAQFLMDITAPDSFGPGGAAIVRILHVRLMHAAIRWFIDHDDDVERPQTADPALMPSRPTWAASWGRPINQEDLAGTLLTFTTVVIDSFWRSGVEFSPQGAEEFLYLWRVVGHFLGIEHDLVPQDLAAATQLQRRIFCRQHGPSAVGAELTTTLLDLVRDRLPRPLARLGPPMMRRYLGDDVADMIGVPHRTSERWLITALVGLTRVLTLGRRVDPIPRWLSDWVGRRLLDGLLRADRHGQRVPFAIPPGLRVGS
jgi:ER-bound oxygenase mpaB/B'/Rubber oxygenase, catalytic domain